MSKCPIALGERGHQFPRRGPEELPLYSQRDGSVGNWRTRRTSTWRLTTGWPPVLRTRGSP